MKISIVLFVILFFAEKSYAYEYEFFFGPSVSSISVDTEFGLFNGVADTGGQAEAMYYVAPSFAVRTHASFAYQLQEQTLATVSIGGGVVWNWIGGGTMETDNTDRVTLRVAPLGNVYSFLELTQVSYDVTAIAPPPIQEKSGVRRRVNRVGSFVGTVLGFGYHTYIDALRLHNLGARVQVNQSMNLSNLSISVLTTSFVYGLTF